MHKTALSSIVVALLAITANVYAAPLDAFLTANRPAEVFKPEVELSYDLANRAVDFLNLRPTRADGTEGPAGDYSGAHIKIGMNVTPDIWIDGALWKRKIDYVSTTADITSWQLGGQWKMIDGGPGGNSIAVRLGAWGDSSPVLRRTTNVTVQGTTFASAQATNPSDTQLQLDLIGTWSVAKSLDLTTLIGAGRSKVDFDRVSATSKSKGCLYDVQFNDTSVVSTCEASGTRISVPNDVFGIDVRQEARYTSSYVNVGANIAWHPGDWRVRGGVMYTLLNRGAIDDIVATRGGTSYKSNTFVLAEVGYKWLPTTLTYIRAQVMAHQFVGEVPLTYNTLTATQHRRRYGILSVGLVQSF